VSAFEWVWLGFVGTMFVIYLLIMLDSCVWRVLLMPTPTGRFSITKPPIQPLPGTLGSVVERMLQGGKAPELDHICCCNPAKAMCGAFVAGQDVKFGGPEKAKNPCQECFNRAADGERCGAPDCPGGEE
jgi:hypothetical protein